jgi:hypothetical protein
MGCVSVYEREVVVKTMRKFLSLIGWNCRFYEHVFMFIILIVLFYFKYFRNACEMWDP